MLGKKVSTQNVNQCYCNSFYNSNNFCIMLFRLLSLAFSSNNLAKSERRSINDHNKEITSQRCTDRARGLSVSSLYVVPRASSASSLKFSGSAKEKVQVGQQANTVVSTDGLFRILQCAGGFTSVLTRSITPQGRNCYHCFITMRPRISRTPKPSSFYSPRLPGQLEPH